MSSPELEGNAWQDFVVEQVRMRRIRIQVPAGLRFEMFSRLSKAGWLVVPHGLRNEMVSGPYLIGLPCVHYEIHAERLEG